MTNAELQALLNDVTQPVVNIPAGDIVIDTRLTVPRSCTIQGAGPTTRLLLRGDNKLTEVTSTLSAQTPVNGLHANGLVTAGVTNTLTVDDPSPFSVNQDVFLRMGVSAADPHEAQDRVWAQVASITGNVLTFKNFYTGPTTTPCQFFMETIPTYSSSDLSWTTYPGRTGVYGTIPPDGGNLIARGYGLDHTIYTFSSLAFGIICQDVAIGLASDVGSAPLWSLGTKWCRDVLFQRITIEDFIGNAINAFESVNVTLDTYTIAAGRPLGVVGQPHFPPIIFNSWGGRNVTFRNGTANVNNAQLIGTEGAKNVAINVLPLTTAHDPKGSATVPASFWTANGLGTGIKNKYPGTTINGFTLLGTMNASIAQQKEDVGLTVYDADIQCTLGNNTDLQDFGGDLEICGTIYYPITSRFVQVTIPVIGAGGLTLVPLPLGLYRRAFIKFANPNQYVQAGVGKIQYPSGNPIYTDGSGGHIPPADTWIELTNFYQVQSAFSTQLDTYFASPKQLKCFGTAGAAATQATIDIDYWSPIARQFP